MSNPTKVIVDCSTGITTEVELTAEEIAQAEADAQAYAVAKAAEEAEAQAKAAAATVYDPNSSISSLSKQQTQQQLYPLMKGIGSNTSSGSIFTLTLP